MSIAIYLKIIILTNSKKVWKAVQVSKFPLIDIIKNLVCVNRIPDFKQNHFFKISKIKADKKFIYNFFNINLSISFNYFSVKKILNLYNKNLSFGQFFDLIILSLQKKEEYKKIIMDGTVL